MHPSKAPSAKAKGVKASPAKRAAQSGRRAGSRSALASPAAATALDAAHKAYLEGDFAAVGARARDVLLDPSASAPARENAFELLDKAYETQGGALPGAEPPPGYGGLQYAYFRIRTPHGIHQLIRFRGTTHGTPDIANITVLARSPSGDVILDRQEQQRAITTSATTRSTRAAVSPSS